MRARTLSLAILLAAWATPAPGQLISIRTVPISQSHQFDLFPSVRGGMGWVALAVDDSLLDPFGNPAKGTRVRASRFYGSPGLYSVSQGAGAGRSLPLGAWLRSGKWFGGVALAVQQVELSDNNEPFLPPPCLECLEAADALQIPPDDRTHGNAFGYAMVGLEFGKGISVAGSAMWADLNAVDGTDLLYPNSVRLRQNGQSLDFRLGAAKEWEGDRTLSGVALYNSYDATHDVFYLDSFWDPGLPGFSQRTRTEANLDHTNVWGMHLQYAYPLSTTGWRMGWVATGNLMSHPKIPNYEIQNIPRDPGNSQAFNFGVGFSRMEKLSTFAFDLIYEPIWSHTWAEAAAPIETEGDTIPTGGKTIENRFQFSNAVLRMGFSQDIPFDQDTKAVGFQLGLALHRIDYSLRQDDNVQITTRHQQEDWLEWMPTWGLSVRFPSWELRYRGSVTNGTGRPGVASNAVFPIAAEPRDGTILVAPSGPLTLTEVKVMTHQVAVSIPLAVSR